MNSKIILAGTVYAVAKKIFQEEETVYVQFLNKKEDGAIDVQKVKLTNKEDIQGVKEGSSLKIPVKISSYEGKLYFTQSEPFLKG